MQANQQRVRLTNGISLNLGAETNVDYGILDTIKVVQNRNSAKEQLDLMQSYYAEVK